MQFWRLSEETDWVMVLDSLTEEGAVIARW